MFIEDEIPEILPNVADEAGKIISFALINEIQIESVEPDIIGGVAIHLSNDDKYIWVSLLNDGTRTIICSITAKIVATSINYQAIMDFLFSD